MLKSCFCNNYFGTKFCNPFVVKLHSVNLSGIIAEYRWRYETVSQHYSMNEPFGLVLSVLISHIHVHRVISIGISKFWMTIKRRRVHDVVANTRFENKL